MALGNALPKRSAHVGAKGQLDLCTFLGQHPLSQRVVPVVRHAGTCLVRILKFQRGGKPGCVCLCNVGVHTQLSNVACSNCANTCSAAIARTALIARHRISAFVSLALTLYSLQPSTE